MSVENEPTAPKREPDWSFLETASREDLIEWHKGLAIDRKRLLEERLAGWTRETIPETVIIAGNIKMQQLIDAGLNGFAVELLMESLQRHPNVAPIWFRYQGLNVYFRFDPEAV